MKNKLKLFKQFSREFFNKSVYPELCRLKGLGKNELSKILFKLKIDCKKKISDLSVTSFSRQSGTRSFCKYCKL